MDTSYCLTQHLSSFEEQYILWLLLRLLLVLGFGNDFGQDFKRDVCYAFSFVGILTCEQLWLLHLRILYVGLRWH